MNLKNEIIAHAGQNIKDVAVDMIELAKSKDCTSFCEFNGVIVQATKYFNVDDVCKMYHNLMEFRDNVYKRSDDYKKYIYETESKKIADKRHYDTLISYIPSIDVNNRYQVLKFISDIAILNDNLSIATDNDLILELLKRIELVGDDYSRHISATIDDFKNMGSFHPIIGYHSKQLINELGD